MNNLMFDEKEQFNSQELQIKKEILESNEPSNFNFLTPPSSTSNNQPGTITRKRGRPVKLGQKK